MLSNHWQDAYELVREQALKFVSLLHNSVCNVVVFSFSLNLFSFNWGRSVVLLQCLSAWSVYYSPCRGVIFNRIVIVMACIYLKLSLFLYDWACVVCGVCHCLFLQQLHLCRESLVRFMLANLLIVCCVHVYVKIYLVSTLNIVFVDLLERPWVNVPHERCCIIVSKFFWKVSSVLCLA